VTPAQLSRTVQHAVRSAVAEGALTAAVPGDVRVERPGPGGCGDYATNIALRLAGEAGLAPRAVAEALRVRIAREPGIAAVEVTGPGFLNLTLGEGHPRAVVTEVLARGLRHGWDGADPDTVPPPPDLLPPGGRAAVWQQTTALLRRTQGLGPATGPAPVPAAGGSPSLLPPAALRWAYLSAAAHDRPRTGPELLAQREGNPLFLVRYAHSRARALTRGAAGLGFTALPGADGPAGLTGLLADHPSVLASAARLHAPDRLVRHLEAVAEALLGFQHTVLPSGDGKPGAAHRSRLAVAEAAGTVLAGGLSLLGISAPEHL
jgi:arginyl-tRNA synthetase